MSHHDELSQSERLRPGEVNIHSWMAYIDRSLAQGNVERSEIKNNLAEMKSDLAEVKECAKRTDDDLHRNGTALIPRVEKLEDRRKLISVIGRGLAVSIPTVVVSALLAFATGILKTQPAPTAAVDLAPLMQEIQQIKEQLDVDTVTVAETKSAPPKRANRDRKRYDTNKPLLNPRLTNKVQAKQKEEIAKAHTLNWAVAAPVDTIMP